MAGTREHEHPESASKTCVAKPAVAKARCPGQHVFPRKVDSGVEPHRVYVA